jgi:hypothetical protein
VADVPSEWYCINADRVYSACRTYGRAHVGATVCTRRGRHARAHVGATVLGHKAHFYAGVHVARSIRFAAGCAQRR